MKLGQATTAMEKYEEAVIALKLWQGKHQKVLDEQAALQEALTSAELALKNRVRASRRSVEGTMYVCQFQPVHESYYDVATVRAILPARILKERAVITVTEEVNDVVLKQLVTENVVSQELVDSAFRKEEKTTRVSIKPKE